MNMPKWCWGVMWTVIIIVVCVLLKFNFSIGSNGIHATQGIVH